MGLHKKWTLILTRMSVMKFRSRGRQGGIISTSTESEPCELTQSGHLRDVGGDKRTESETVSSLGSSPESPFWCETEGIRSDFVRGG